MSGCDERMSHTSWSRDLLTLWIVMMGQLFLVALVTAQAGIFTLPVVVICHTTIGVVWVWHSIHKRVGTSKIPRDRSVDTLSERGFSPAAILYSGIGGMTIAACFQFSWHTPIHLWDDLAYHLPIVGSIVSSGSLMPAPASYPIISSSVSSIHLIYASFQLFLRDSWLISVVHASFLPLGILATYCLIRMFNIRRDTAILLSVCAGLSPVLLLQTASAYVDIAFASIFITALYFGLEWMRMGDRFVVSFSLSLALLFGCKPHSPLYGMILIVWLVLFGPIPWNRDVPRRYSGLLVLSILLGLFWTIAKWVYFGNPLYPFEFDIFGWFHFAGTTSLETSSLTVRSIPPALQQCLDSQAYPATRFITRLVFSWLELGPTDHFSIHSFSGGFGAVTAILLLPSSMMAWFRGGKHGRSLNLLITLIALTPVSFIARYVPMIPFLLAASASTYLNVHPRRYLASGLVLLADIITAFMFPGFSSDFGVLLKNALSGALVGQFLGILTLVLLPILIAVFCRARRDLHWPALLFLPALLIQISLCKMVPVVGFPNLSNQETTQDILLALWNWKPLSNQPLEKEHAIMAIRKGEIAVSNETIVYSGRPFPCAIGLLWNRRCDNQVFYVAALDQADRIIAFSQSIPASICEIPQSPTADLFRIAVRDHTFEQTR